MTVQELIERLQSLSVDDRRLIVVSEGYEDGFNDLKEIERIEVVPRPFPAWYEGEYEKPEAASGAPAIYLRFRARVELEASDVSGD